jgi:hypothetical protein
VVSSCFSRIIVVSIIVVGDVVVVAIIVVAIIVGVWMVGCLLFVVVVVGYNHMVDTSGNNNKNSKVNTNRIVMIKEAIESLFDLGYVGVRRCCLDDDDSNDVVVGKVSDLQE